GDPMSLDGPRLDHVVVVVGPLADAVAVFTSAGFTVTPGGRHDALPTENALVCFADGTYLELLATRESATRAELRSLRGSGGWERGRTRARAERSRGGSRSGGRARPAAPRRGRRHGARMAGRAHRDAGGRAGRSLRRGGRTLRTGAGGCRGARDLHGVVATPRIHAPPHTSSCPGAWPRASRGLLRT